MSANESEFLLIHINKTHKVLEWGAGESTIQISKKCRVIKSIEHDLSWYDQVYQNLPDNARIFYCPPKYPCKPPNDGNEDQFGEYIHYPKSLKIKFDIILIDGRARVGCAKACKDISHENTIVFIHDYDRLEYKEAENYLELIEMVGTLAKFKVK